MRNVLVSTTVATMLLVALASASASAGLTVSLGDAAKGGVLANRHAFCPPAGTDPANVSLPVTWSTGPAGTRSYALLMRDEDVPEALDQIDRPGVTFAPDAPRMQVYHWVLADIPSAMQSLAEGAEGAGFEKGGKPVGPTDHGVRGGNVYASFFASNPDMAGSYGGYDGPCPPTNDPRPHRYVVEVFALDVESLALSEGFTGEQLAKAMVGHILAQGETAATYSRWKQTP